MDITLDDLLIMEPHLRLAEGGEASLSLQRPRDVRVSWAVTTRTLAPHLPTLRGGEVILALPRVVSELGEHFASLLREAASRNASAVVVANGTAAGAARSAAAAGLPLLTWHGGLALDTETAINRRLTEWRGALYRAGSEFERQVADVGGGGAGLGPVLRVAASVSGLPLTVVDHSGRKIAAYGIRGGIDEQEQHEIHLNIDGRGVLTLGPFAVEQRPLARFLGDRIAALVASAMRHDEASRPRGARRLEATEALLSWRRGSASELRAAALALGLDPDAHYFVAVAHGATEQGLVRALTPLGTVCPVGGSNGRRAALVAANSRAAASWATRVVDIKRRWELEHKADGATLALSAPAFGVVSVPGAAREAEFVASLQMSPEFTRKAASFDSVDDVGAMRLLYHLRETRELRAFVSQALGGLEQRDQRGTLRKTLRAFLESGGSQVDASHRLGIHRNTLAYRLRRIGELVGRDVGDPGTWLTLHLALHASELLDVYGDDA
ncbi:MAG: helix-turn-helix domain-containing protein [Thermomicrobiales bacterium]|nr:helix-turn-helix domain-containing protein [Thermomicrobiales bacterium]